MLPCSPIRRKTNALELEDRRLSDKVRVLLAIGEMSGGGSQRQLLGILRGLDRARFSPSLYLVSSGGELIREVPQDVPIDVFAERVKTPWYAAGPPFWTRIHAYQARMTDLARVIRQRQIDVVYDRTYHMTLTAAGAVRRARRAGPVARVSVIVTDPQQDFETNRERFRSVKRFLLRRAYRSADRVVAVSEGVREAAIQHYGLPPDKILTLYNFFDIERIDRQMHQPLPPGEQKQPGRFEIVAAGRMHPQKGFIDLLSAMRLLVHDRGLSQLHLRILGAGPQEGELRQFLERNRLHAHVTLAGFRDNPLPYFRQADLFCLSSRYEGMPNALVEAMLCRVPVLATDCPSGPREILLGGQLGRLVAPGDARALAAEIADALRHPEARQARVPAARLHIEQQFSPAAGIDKLQALLQSVAGDRSGQ
jgi:glycosyltransferase involved in cell wall biosynthesis